MEDILSQVRTIVAAYASSMPPDDADIRTCGVDSVDALEMFAEIESRFGIHFEELDFSQFNTIQAIAALISQKLGLA